MRNAEKGNLNAKSPRCKDAKKKPGKDWFYANCANWREGEGQFGLKSAKLALFKDLFRGLVFSPLRREWPVARRAPEAAPQASDGGEHFGFGRLQHGELSHKVVKADSRD